MEDGSWFYNQACLCAVPLACLSIGTGVHVVARFAWEWLKPLEDVASHVNLSL